MFSCSIGVSDFSLSVEFFFFLSLKYFDLATNTNTGHAQSWIRSHSQSFFVGLLMNLTSAGLDSTVIDDIRLAIMDMETGKMLSFLPPVRNSWALPLPLLAQAK